MNSIKRILAVFFACVLTSLVSVGYAEIDFTNEEFSVRNNIHFGMTKQEVADAEVATSGFIRADLEENYVAEDGTTEALIQTRVAGIDESYIYFEFDEDGGLYSFIYEFAPANVEEKYKSIYDEMRTALYAKYGEPVYEDSGDLIGILTERATEYLVKNSKTGELKKYNYCEWLVEYKNGFVLIDLVFSGAENLWIKDGLLWKCDIAYRLCTEEEVLQANQLLEEEKNQREEDKNSDL